MSEKIKNAGFATEYGGKGSKECETNTNFADRQKMANKFFCKSTIWYRIFMRKNNTCQ